MEDLYKELKDYAYGKLGDEQEAHDVATGTLVVLGLKYCAEKGSKRNYAITINNNRIKDVFRKHKKSFYLEDFVKEGCWEDVIKDTSTGVHSVEQGIIYEQQIEQVQEIVRELTTTNRTILQLVLEYDFDYDKISNVLGVSAVACRKRYSRAVSEVKSQII